MLKMTFLAASWGHFDHLARKHSKTPRKLEKTEKTGLEATFEVTWSARKHRTCAQIQPRGRFEATSRSLGRSKTLENTEKARKRSKTPRKLEKTEKTRENRGTRPHRGHLPREHRENSRLLKNTEKTRARRGHLSRDNLRKPRILFKETVRVNWLGFTGLCFTSLCSLHSDMYMSGSH